MVEEPPEPPAPLAGDPPPLLAVVVPLVGPLLEELPVEPEPEDVPPVELEPEDAPLEGALPEVPVEPLP